MRRSGSGEPPSADSRIAFMPQVGASTQEIGRTQYGKKVERHEEAADQPDRVLEHVPERPGGAEADEARRRTGSRARRT